MPRLKFVNLSFNQLSTPLQPTEVEREFKLQHLRSLVLNSTKVIWESVNKILDHSPCLEELHLSLNEYNDVQLTPGAGDNGGILTEDVINEEEVTNNCECPKDDK